MNKPAPDDATGGSEDPPTLESPDQQIARRHEQRVMDRSVVTGIAWTGSAKWLTQLISWATTILVARILTPHDLGVVGLAAVYLGLAGLVSTFGLGAAVIQRSDLPPRRISEISGVSIAFGALLCGLSAALAWPLAAFFHEPRVRDVIIALGSLFVAGGVAVVPRALLTREFRFRELAMLDSVEAVVQAAAALILALLGAGYWALVCNQIVAKLVSLALLLRIRRHGIGWPARLADLGAELLFGWRFVVSQVAWYTYSNADFLVVGRLLGTHAMGIYSLGWQLATVPVERVSALLSGVTPALFSAVKQDQAALRRYFGAMTRGLAFVTLPMSVGLLLVADHLVLALLGVKWEQAILPLQILAAYSALRAIAVLYPMVLMYVGEERSAMRFNVLLAVLMPLLFAAGSAWGVTGVALAWLVGYPVVAIVVFLRRTLLVVGMSWRAYVQLLIRPATGTLLMAVLVLGVRLVAPSAWSAAATLVLTIAVGASVYATFVYALCRDEVRALIRIARDRPT